MNTCYIKNFNRSEFLSIFDRLQDVSNNISPIWCGIVYIGTEPIYLKCNIKCMADKIEQYFVKAIPNTRISNAPELVILNNLHDIIPQIDASKEYVCFIDDNIYKKPDLIINQHCLFIKKENTSVIALNDSDDNFLYLGENHLLMKLLNHVLDKPNFAVVHGAVVGFNNCGILITGMSGYGKSTLSGHCLAHGLQFIGDDRIALTKKDRTLFANPIYTTLSLVDNIPSELKILYRSRPENSTKDILVLDKSLISENIQIVAVIEPSKKNNGKPEIIPATPANIITRICMDFSKFSVLTPSKNQIADWNKIFGLLGDAKFFNIKLSQSISDNVDTIINFIKSEVNNVQA